MRYRRESLQLHAKSVTRSMRKYVHNLIGDEDYGKAARQLALFSIAMHRIRTRTEAVAEIDNEEKEMLHLRRKNRVR